MNIWSSCSPNIEIRKLDESPSTALVNNNVWLAKRNALILEPADAVNKHTELVLFSYAVSGNHKTADLSSVNEGSQPEHIYSVAASIIHSR